MRSAEKMMMNQNAKSGMTIFEVLIFILLFTVGFIPGHLVAQKAGIVGGLAAGIATVLVLRIILGQMAMWFDKATKRKLPK